MTLSLVTALLLAAEPVPATWCTARLHDWALDGSAVVWNVELCNESSDPTFMLVTRPDGRPVRLFREGTREMADAPDPDSEAPYGTPTREMAWIKSTVGGDHSAFSEWAKSHPLASMLPKPFLISETAEHDSGRNRVSVRTRTASGGCPPALLQLSVGTSFVDVFEDRCLPGEPNHRGTEGAAVMAWSPDGQRLAVAWNILRSTTGETASPGYPAGTLRRAYVTVISRAALEGKEPFRTVKRILCPVDLLDASSGKAGLDALSGKLTNAGFTVAHRGKAGKDRTATEVYYAQGFEPEAREAAALAGVAEDDIDGAVKPLTWKSPYPVTIAVGATR